MITLHMDFHEGNRIRGTLPAEIGQCVHLEELILNGHKNLVGVIPSTFANLTKLRVVHLDENQLSGTIPKFFSELQDLEELQLAKNRFIGTVPDGIESLPNLNAVDLSGNARLEGYIPFMGVGFQEETDKLMANDDESMSDFAKEMEGSINIAHEHDNSVPQPYGHDGEEL